MRYTGSKIICSTRLIGNIDRLNGRFPFAIFVNTRYQSVHGVKMSMKNPINMSMFPFKNNDPRKYPNSGVHMKLIIRVVDVNLTFLKLFFNLDNGTSRNSPKSIRHRNMLIKLLVLSAISCMLENINPIITAENIIRGSSFSINSIFTPLFRYN